MLKTTLELKVKDTHKLANQQLDNIDLLIKNMINEIIEKSNNLSTFSVFEIPGQIFDNFVNQLSSQVPLIGEKFNQIMDLYDTASNIFRVSGDTITFTAGVTNFNTLYNYVTSQLANDQLQYVINWPPDYKLVSSYVDPYQQLTAQGWECYRELGICQLKDKNGNVISVKTFSARY